MKAVITQKSELSINLLQSYTFDILSDNGDVLLTNQAIQCSPSNAISEIKQKVLAYEQEYQLSQELPEGMEIS